MVSGSKRLNVTSYIKEVIAMIQARPMKVTVRIEKKDG